MQQFDFYHFCIYIQGRCGENNMNQNNKIPDNINPNDINQFMKQMSELQKNVLQKNMPQMNMSQNKTTAPNKSEKPKDEPKKIKVIMQFPLSYSLRDAGGIETAHGEASVQLAEDSLTILPKFGEVIFLTFRDITELSEGNYKVQLALTSNETMVLFNLGYRYEDFLRVFARLRNEMFLKDLLMQENLRKADVAAEVVHLDENGKEKLKAKCSVRLYDTGIVIIPEKSDLVRIPYSDISGIKDEDFTLTLTTESGDKYAFSMLGKQYDSTLKTLSKIINELSLAVQSSLKEVAPEANPAIIRKAAQLMKEGKAARKADIESISPELWAGLEKKLEATGTKEEYDFLVSMAQKDKLCIGIKRGLMGGLTGDYIWFLIPIYSTNHQEPGNAVAMEAISEEGGGKATYFFRLVGRNVYQNLNSIDELHRAADDFITKINRCMLTINFRREPIYLSDDKLAEPGYQKYRFAIQKIPSLQTLRALYIGRVIHSSLEQWKQDVMDLLRYNISAPDDVSKWSKAGEENIGDSGEGAAEDADTTDSPEERGETTDTEL
jgi:hypothetical protein